MKTLFILAALVSLVLFAKISDARRLDVDTKNQPNPGLIVQGLANVAELANELKKAGSFWVYDEDTESEEKSITKKFGSKPGFWVYGDDDDKSLVKEFGSKPGFWVYGDDDKSRNEDLSTSKFGAKPGFWVYNDEGKVKEENSSKN